MIKIKKHYEQSFHIESQRVVVSSETSEYYMFGIKLFQLKHNTSENQIKHDTKIGFK